MKCTEVEFGTFQCAYCIDLPYLVDGRRKNVAIDKCLLPEVLKLWEQGIKTTGCCCGHGREEPYIGVDFGDIEKMKSLGYRVQYNPSRPDDEDSFFPKTQIIREEPFDMFT